MRTYRTKSGDTWDKIAYEQLGSEYLLPFLLQENQQYRQYVQFPAGIELNIPDIELTIEEKPDWIEEEDENEDEVTEESEQPWLTEDALD
jgi:phage tail protein X